MSNFYTEPFVSAGEMEFPSEPYITAQPQNHTAAGPEEYVLTVIAAGAVSYQWEVFDGESWSTIPGATSDTLTINIDSSMNGWRYRVLVTGADGSTVTSKAAQIAVRGVHECTLEGAIVTFTGPARIKSLEVDINPIQSGTGDPSPTNIRPISGWDSVNVVRTGKNLLKVSDANKIIFSENYNNATVNSDGSVSITGQTLITFVVPVKIGETYTISWGTPTGDAQLTARAYGYDEMPTSYGTPTTIASIPTTNVKTTYTFTSNFPYVAVGFYATASLGAYTIDYMQIEKGSTATAYSPYQDTTYPISLGQTVYGGVLDVVSGVLTVDRYYITLANASRLNFIASSNMVELIFASGKGANASQQANAISNMYPFRNPIVDKSAKLYGSEIDIKDSDFTDEATARILLANFIAVYKLSNSNIFTVQLTPQEINTLTGVNNIWADSGDIRVTIIR